MNDVTVDLGPISLFDAKAVRLALQIAMGEGYFTDPDVYGAVMTVKAMLNVRIAKAEKVAEFVEPG